MSAESEKFNIVGFLAGVCILIFLCWLLFALFIQNRPEYQTSFYIFLGLVAVGLVVLTYFCIKSPEVRRKTLGIGNNLMVAISQMGVDALKNAQSSQQKQKKPPRKKPKDGLQQALFRAHNHRCALCGKLEGLEIHHIDGNRSNSSDPRNLIPLCRNCHKRAETMNKNQLISAWKPPKYKTH